MDGPGMSGYAKCHTERLTDEGEQNAQPELGLRSASSRLVPPKPSGIRGHITDKGFVVTGDGVDDLGAVEGYIAGDFHALHCVPAIDESGEWLGREESGSTTIRNVVLALVALVALPLALWRSSVADRQANTAQQGLLNERYQKWSEMLGSHVLSVRLARAYALQSVAMDYPEQYHVQIMRLFCAFIRLPTRDEILESVQASIGMSAQLGIRQDVEAVMEAIGSRPGKGMALEQRADFRLDLRGANLGQIQILQADLSRAMFHRSNLSGVNFANTDLTDAFLPYADLSRAHFHAVTFTRTRLWSTNLSGATLQDAEMIRMNLHDVIFAGANSFHDQYDIRPTSDPLQCAPCTRSGTPCVGGALPNQHQADGTPDDRPFGHAL